MGGPSLLLFALNGVALSVLILGLIIVGRKTSSRLHQAFFLLTVALSGWIVSNSIYLSLHGQARFIDALVSYVCAALTATMFFVFAGILTSQQKRLKSLAVVGVALSVSSGIPGLVASGVSEESIHTTPGIIGYALYLLTAFIFGIVLLLRGRSSAVGSRRQQIDAVLLGIVGAIAGGVLFNLVLPIMGNYRYVTFGPIFSVLFVFSFAYSILRHHLFDIRRAFARSLAYIGSVLVLGVLYGFLVVLLVDQLNISGVDLKIALIVATVIITILYPPTKSFFDTITEQIFFHKLYNIQQAIDEITGVFVKAESLDELLKVSARELKHFVGAESVTITLTTQSAAQRVVYSTLSDNLEVGAPVLTQAHMLATKQKVLAVEELGEAQLGLAEELNKVGVAMLAQLHSPTELVGYVLFGYKQNGASYTAHDIEFVDIVSDEFSIAIQNMQRFQEISHFNAELQKKITDATTELRVSNDKLHELDRSKDEFISMASHQLRTPLTSVKGYISMVLDGDVGEISDKQREVLEQAYASSQRMVYLIGDFLNVSRLQTGKFELEKSSIDLAALIQEEIEQLQETARTSQVTLKYDKPTQISAVSADENKLRQVMMNFIDNAIYYTQPNTVVQVQLFQEGGDIVFRVIDQGIGVPESERHNLFTKFFRASNAKRKRPDGTGIGLYMAKKVVLAHEGSMIFESQEGKGSTFGFRLPISVSTDAKKPEQ